MQTPKTLRRCWLNRMWLHSSPEVCFTEMLHPSTPRTWRDNMKLDGMVHALHNHFTIPLAQVWRLRIWTAYDSAGYSTLCKSSSSQCPHRSGRGGGSSSSGRRPPCSIAVPASSRHKGVGDAAPSPRAQPRSGPRQLLQGWAPACFGTWRRSLNIQLQPQCALTTRISREVGLAQWQRVCFTRRRSAVRSRRSTMFLLLTRDFALCRVLAVEHSFCREQVPVTFRCVENNEHLLRLALCFGVQCGRRWLASNASSRWTRAFASDAPPEFGLRGCEGVLFPPE